MRVIRNEEWGMRNVRRFNLTTFGGGRKKIYMCKNVKQNVLFERSEFTFCSFCMCKSRPETKSEDETPKQNRWFVDALRFWTTDARPCVPTFDFIRFAHDFAPARQWLSKLIIALTNSQNSTFDFRLVTKKNLLSPFSTINFLLNLRTYIKIHINYGSY